MLAIDEKYFPTFRQEMIDVGEGIKINTFVGGVGSEAILLLHGHPESHLIFAFRLDGTAIAALKDIEERQYALPYILYKHRLHKVGAVFSNATGSIEEWMAAD